MRTTPHITLVIFFASGCGDKFPKLSDHEKSPDFAIATLMNAEQFEVLSIEPSGVSQEEQNYYGVKVLGKVMVNDPATRQSVLDAVKADIRGTQVAACFEPRHGIRIKFEGQTIDYAICYQCGRLEIKGGDERFKNSSFSMAVFHKKYSIAS